MSFQRLLTKIDIKKNIEQKEIEFLQVGIETLVEKIHDLVYLYANSEIIKQKLKLQEVLTDIDLVEVKGTENILKVGSFYERTKIIFPDEFDFILIFGTFKMVTKEAIGHKFGHGSLLIFGMIETILKHPGIIKYLVYAHPDTHSVLKFDRFVLMCGPAVKLKFKYLKCDICRKDIYVDLVPAFKIIDKCIEAKIHKMCSVPDFGKAVVDTGSFLITRNSISFTESEVQVMKRISITHIQVYKILKYLINGNKDGEKLKNGCNLNHIEDIHISSYKIKTCLIYHVYACANGNDVIKCICEILTDLQMYWLDRRWPNLVAGLHMSSNYGGNFVSLRRGRKYREKGEELLAGLSRSFNLLDNGSHMAAMEQIEPWSISLLRTVEIGCLLNEMVGDITYS